MKCKMNKYGVEKIWLYLHDNPQVVNPNEFVTNTYRYLNNLLDMLNRNPESIDIIKERMELERIGDSDFFLKLRKGYGKTEYRLKRLFTCGKLGNSLKKLFPELIEENEVSQIKQR